MKIKTTQPIFRVLSVFTLVAVLTVQSLLIAPAYAGQITLRSLTLQANGAVGGATPGGVVNHFFNLTTPTAGNVGAVKYEYCTTAADVGAAVCTSPTGLDVSAATLGSEAGFTGVEIVGIDTKSFYIKPISNTPIAMGANAVLQHQFGNITNPSTTNTTFFVRISTYTTIDATGTAVDAGTVTASTSTNIELSGIMPESLVFCTGATIPLGAGSVPDCANAASGVITFNQLFSPTDTATSTSQMAASTNAGAGYAISVNGPTLTSGSNTVTAMAAPLTSIKGTGQFGLNLKANTIAAAAAAFGAEVSPATDPVNDYRGQAASGYELVDTFSFISGSTVANSYAGGAGASNAQIYTVSYIANVPGSQPAGTYSTTLTYICTPTY